MPFISKDRYLAAVIFLFACGGTSQPEPFSVSPGKENLVEKNDSHASRSKKPKGKLPKGVLPKSYNVTLKTDPAKPRFEGKVSIEIQIKKPTRKIYLHGKDLEVSRATITTEKGKEHLAKYKQVDETGLSFVSTKGELPIGAATITIEYKAPFGKALAGLYHVKHDGEDYAFTQFEATSARLCFPSFDEPRFKVPFRFSIASPKENKVVFNTPETSSEEENGWTWHTFAKTPPLPTYLIAMAVGPLDIVQGPAIPSSDVRSRTVPLRGIAAKGKGKDLNYALANTGKLLASLEKYFGMPYPYKKLDIVAVPDFAAGAMENVGLITFREQYLLLPKNFAVNQERAFAFVMAHELAHQWFGNLVTMPWWDDIWLNEAFATWVEYKAVKEHYPAFRPYVSKLLSSQYAMNGDSLASARQIRQPIQTHADIGSAFDSITYSKGGAVLSMFENWVGEEVFRQGIQVYLKQNRERTATYADLLDAIDSVSEKKVRKAFETFLFQPGIPLLQFSVEGKGSESTIMVKQSRYAPAGSPIDPSSNSWTLPVCLRVKDKGGNRVVCELLSKEKAVFDESFEKLEWLMPNANASGYYLYSLGTDYDRKLSKEFNGLSALERLAVVKNVQAAFAANRIEAADYLSYLAAQAKDRERRIVVSGLNGILSLKERYATKESAGKYDAWIRKTYGKRLRELGLATSSKDDSETILLRASLVTNLALSANDSWVRKWAQRMGRRSLGYPRGNLNLDTVPRDMLQAVLAVAMQEDGKKVFEYARKQFRASDDAIYRSAFLKAIGFVDPENEELMNQVFDLILNEELRTNESYTTLRVLASRRETKQATWDWFRSNYDKLSSKRGATAFGDSAAAPAAHLCEPESVSEIENFYRPHVGDLRGGDRTIRKLKESVRLCLASKEQHRKAVEAIF